MERRTAMTPAYLELLRRLALNDDRALNEVVSGRVVQTPLLDEKTAALVRLAALLAMESSSSSQHSAVDAALAAGAEDDEIVEVLLSVAPILGTARINAAAPHLAAALGDDLDGLV